MALEIGAAIKSAEELDKAVGLIAKAIGKLKAQPDLAAQKLSQALSKVAKTLQVVDTAATQYMSLGIDEGALSKNSKELLQIEGGGLKTEVARGRGHCHVIGNIYFKYLDKWFERVWKGDQYKELREVFVRLGDADDDLFADLGNVAVALEQEAHEVLNLVLKNEEAQARTRVLAALPILRPLRKTIARTMESLYAIQGELADVTGAV